MQKIETGIIGGNKIAASENEKAPVLGKRIKDDGQTLDRHYE